MADRLPLRALKIATIVMGLMIVLGTVVVVTVLVRRASSDAGAGAAGGSAERGGEAPVAAVLLDEPDGTRIAGVAGWADRLAVTLQGGGPDRVAVIDARSGRVVQRIALRR